jgi:predicted ATPase
MAHQIIQPFVDLAPLTDASMALTTIGRTLGMRRGNDQLLAPEIAQFLAGKQILLVLDNFEHVIAAALAVTEILRAALE